MVIDYWLLIIDADDADADDDDDDDNDDDDDDDDADDDDDDDDADHRGFETWLNDIKWTSFDNLAPVVFQGFNSVQECPLWPFCFDRPCELFQIHGRREWMDTRG